MITLRQTLALGLAAAVLAATTPVRLGAQQTASLSGTAKNEVAKPYFDFIVQTRNVQTGLIVGTVPLKADDASWAFTGLPPARYLVELVRVASNKIVCAEGPFNLVDRNLTKDDVNIHCNNLAAAWWLFSAAGAAGVTSGVVYGAVASPAQ